MKKPYLIELRLEGTAKHVCRKLTYDISKKFNVKGNVRKRPVPHITLFGPFNTRRIKDILQSIQEIGSQYSSLDYSVDGFDFFEKKKTFLGIPTSKKKDVIYLKIKPCKSLVQCQKMLAKKLFPITNTSKFDNPKDKFHFHATLAMKDISKKFDKIWEYLENYEIKFEDQCFRLTVLRDSKIMYEYDLTQKKLLTRRQALNRNLKNKIKRQRKQE
jgi:2'-5' RNA ligase